MLQTLLCNTAPAAACPPQPCIMPPLHLPHHRTAVAISPATILPSHPLLHALTNLHPPPHEHHLTCSPPPTPHLTPQARQDIEAAKSELAAARLERQQLEEYEVLRRQVHKEVPRWKRQQQMQQVRRGQWACAAWCNWLVQLHGVPLPGQGGCCSCLQLVSAPNDMHATDACGGYAAVSVCVPLYALV